MTRDQIKFQIEENLKARGMELANEGLRVQEDPYSGWLIAVISPGFEGKSRADRKEAALNGLESLKVEWLELLTPEEQEWTGSLPGDMEVEDLPFWPEALARGSQFEKAESQLHFLSEIDDDIDPPITATFYSLRGGVGRSTAMAYTSHILASQGKKVICVDMDLEAPGITALFGKENDIPDNHGLVHLLVAIDQGETPDVAKHLIRISETYDLYCLPAGKTNANYARTLRFIDPESWYREDKNPLRILIDNLKENLPFIPDVILLDARTGITQMSGPLLFDLSDIAVIVFFPHPQAKTGTEALTKALMASKTRRKINNRSFTPEIRFLVSPIPASKAREVIQRYEHRAIEWIADWISPLKNLAGSSGADIIETDITHFVPYRETIATSDQIMQNDDIWRNYSQLAEWIDSFGRGQTDISISETLTDAKEKILDQLTFSTGTAEQQEGFKESFVETELVKKALSPQIPLILGRKGTGKTAIFRHLVENGADASDVRNDAFVITTPPDLSNHHQLYIGTDGFKSVEEILTNQGADWREFWGLYIAMVYYYSSLAKRKSAPLPDSDELRLLFIEKPISQLEICNIIEKFLKHPNYGLHIEHWLTVADQSVESSYTLLFDGLDTGFGNEEKDRKRRNNAINGLFTFMTDTGNRLKNFKFKILLREDIWNALKFENKSHFFGRSLSLRWVDQFLFLKVIIKQALRNHIYKKLLQSTNLPTTQGIEYWGEQQVISAWNILAGERTKGGKSAFTRNWVWKRLADGNNDHSPRYLLQLMNKALEWEKREQKRIVYDRSIIRPRAIMQVLPEVSEQALNALIDEEFKELEPLTDSLKTKRTPIDATQLQTHKQLIDLAMEVGLLAVYEESDEEVSRYMVPEIYRHALKMTRKGQM